MKTTTMDIIPPHADFVDVIEGKLKEWFGPIGPSPKLQANHASHAPAGHAHAHRATAKHHKARRH